MKTFDQVMAMVVGLAIIAALVSTNSNTSNLLTQFFNSITTALKVLMAPASAAATNQTSITVH